MSWNIKLNNIPLKVLIYGITTLIPFIYKKRKPKTGGSDSARYCYSVWLRHLIFAKENGLSINPKIVAEIGPGDSLGVGLAALLSGSEKYYAFDIIKYSNLKDNVSIFDEIVQLFKNKEDIPSDEEFPKLKPYLNDYSFPHDIFTDEKIKKNLNDTRIAKIRNDLTKKNSEKYIVYKVPWLDKNIIENESVDLILSQAVLEHVDSLKDVYSTMNLWIKPKGYISHQVDFKCHGFSKLWNGHYLYSKLLWKLITGKRPVNINRMPPSYHLGLIKEFDFKILSKIFVKTKSEINKEHLPKDFKNLLDHQDLNISGMFFQAIKLK